MRCLAQSQVLPTNRTRTVVPSRPRVPSWPRCCPHDRPARRAGPPAEPKVRSVELRQIAQRAVDLDRAASFYQRLLGSEPLASFDPPGLVFFNLAGTRLLLDRAAPPALIYLGVD